MIQIPTYTVDSFTTEAFKGNPAGVCLLEKALDEKTMHMIAQELNLSETAFIVNEDAYCRIRFFSPIKEIPLCGHATLAAAKVLFEEKGLIEVHFKTNNQVDLHVSKVGDQIEMQFPSYETTPANASNEILNALNITNLHDARFNEENNILMLVIDEAELLSLQPDFKALVTAHDSISGVLVTSSSSENHYDITSRYFWPWSGGDEDPVTGATHTFMAPYWAGKLNKSFLKSFQASKRTGFMDVTVNDSKNVVIKGHAVVVIKGSLIIR